MELTLFVDHACNLRCSYCYNGKKFSRPMPAEVMRGSVNLALASRPAQLDVSFFGGEPLLHPRFIEETLAHVQTAVRALPEPHPRVRYVINTNRTRVDDRVLALLAPARDFTVYVALDGPAAVHDAHRVDEDGQGSFAGIVANLERLRQAGIAFRLVAVVRPDTARRLGEVMRTLLDLRPAQVTLTPDFRAPWTAESTTELRLGLRDAGEVWMTAFRDGHALPLEPLRGKILTHLKEGIPCPERCTLAGRAFAVTPTGRLYPCAQMIGDDRDDELVIGTGGLDVAMFTEHNSVNMAIRHKHLKLDQTKIDKARRLLGLSTEQETVKTALDLVIAEEPILRAHRKVKGIGGVVDLFGAR